MPLRPGSRCSNVTVSIVMSSSWTKSLIIPPHNCVRACLQRMGEWRPPTKRFIITNQSAKLELQSSTRCCVPVTMIPSLMIYYRWHLTCHVTLKLNPFPVELNWTIWRWSVVMILRIDTNMTWNSFNCARSQIRDALWRRLDDFMILTNSDHQLQ